MWIADDGSYGSGSVEKFDTTNWTEEDFDTVESATDEWRLTLAREIDHYKNAS